MNPYLIAFLSFGAGLIIGALVTLLALAHFDVPEKRDMTIQPDNDRHLHE